MRPRAPPRSWWLTWLNWSPKIRRLAAAELGGRSIDTATRDDIRAKALDVNGNSRYGAIQALGEIDDTGFTGQLVSLLNDNDGYVRTLAAKALHKFQQFVQGALPGVHDDHSGFP